MLHRKTLLTILHFIFQIFGPVMQILKFSTIEEVIERSNNTPYGLAAGVHTTSLERALQYSSGVRAGTVWYVNLFSIRILYLNSKQCVLFRAHCSTQSHLTLLLLDVFLYVCLLFFSGGGEGQRSTLSNCIYVTVNVDNSVIL